MHVISFEVSDADFEKMAALAAYLGSYGRDDKPYTIECYLLELIDEDLYKYRHEIADIIEEGTYGKGG